MSSIVKRLLVGRPLSSADESHQRLVKVIALAIFASDAISSTAYATEEILHVLVPVAAAEALEYLIPISLIVMVLLIIVITSYRQVIFAYPGGGGAYNVSKDNLGETPSLVAGASLLVDYVLTVAVSISAGVAAITSAVPDLRDNRVSLCLLFIGLLMLANLRGLKESGQVFAVPTYIYVASLGALLAYGLYRSYLGDLGPLPPAEDRYDEFTKGGALMTGVNAYAFARAFSSGAVALTGIEAISNGVQTFKKPESRNAATTLVWMGVILAVYFFGISLLAHRLQPTLNDHETILSILGRAVFGGGALYYILQAATAVILLLAANTAFAGFPQIASILARDRYLPRQLHNRGDRLVFSNGIIALAVVAALLVAAFGGVTTALIPLYAVGVFTGFTLSQYGMVKHHQRLREPGWRPKMIINYVGATATGIVLIVVVVSKFTIGAWVPVILIPFIVFLLRSVKRHYDRVSAALFVPTGYRPRRHTHTFVVLVGSVHRATLVALAYAKSLAPDRLVALTVVDNEEEAESIQEQWDRFHLDTPLTIQSSPYRELTGPVLHFLDELDAQYDNDIITVILPEFVLTKWWEQLLHNQSALMLKGRLLFRRNTVVVSVPYHISAGEIDAPSIIDTTGPDGDKGAAPGGKAGKRAGEPAEKPTGADPEAGKPAEVGPKAET
ncbi:APC family permease [soil metagenome]